MFVRPFQPSSDWFAGLSPGGSLIWVRQVRLLQRSEKSLRAILNPHARPGQPVCHLGGRSIRTSPRISVILHTTGTLAGRPAAGRKTGPPESTFTFVLADRPPQ